MTPQAWLRARLRSHNRHAIGLALLAVCAAALAWLIAWSLFMLLLLGFFTAIRGDIGVGLPFWAAAAGGGFLFFLLLWGWFDQFRNRYAGAPDRQVVGWHLIPDFVLLPPRLTFAILGNISAFRRLNHDEINRAWELIVSIRQNGKGHLRSLTLIEPDANLLFKLITTLQMLELIDLHRGEGDWYYTLRSTKFEQIGTLLAWQE
jgi:hypothetical protein